MLRVDNFTSSRLTLSTGVPQGCILSSFLYSLYMLDCMATQASSTAVKIGNNNPIVRLISCSEEVTALEQRQKHPECSKTKDPLSPQSPPVAQLWRAGIASDISE